MTLRRTILTATTAAALTLLVGCGSMGGLGGILGGTDPNNSGYPSSGSQNSRIQGTVNSVDTRNQRIDLNVYSNNGRSGQRTTIYYDNRTRVSYRNQSGNPGQLERGDQIDVTLYNNGNGQALADTITVTQSVSDNSNGSPNNNYPNTYPNTPGNNYPNTYPSNGQASDVQGTVSRVDTQRQRIDMSVSFINGLRNSQSNYSIYYDNRTRVLYQNQTHSPADLEQGDQIEVRLVSNGNNSGNGQALADTITVTRNVRQ